MSSGVWLLICRMARNWVLVLVFLHPTTNHWSRTPCNLIRVRCCAVIGQLPGTPREIGVALVISGIDTVFGDIGLFLSFGAYPELSIEDGDGDGEMVNSLHDFWSSRIISLSLYLFIPVALYNDYSHLFKSPKV